MQIKLNPALTLLNGLLLLGCIPQNLPDQNLSPATPPDVSPTAAIVEPTNADYNVRPPYKWGVFIMSDGTPFRILPQYNPAQQVAGLQLIPIVQSSSPVVISNDPWLTASELKLIQVYGAIGVRTSVVEADGLTTVVDVYAGSAAGNAGIQPGDVILAVDGQELTGSRDADDLLLWKGRVGKNAQVRLLRGRQTLELTVNRDVLEATSYSVGYPFEIEREADYVRLFPTDELAPGVYCYADFSVEGAGEVWWCFELSLPTDSIASENPIRTMNPDSWIPASMLPEMLYLTSGDKTEFQIDSRPYFSYETVFAIKYDNCTRRYTDLTGLYHSSHVFQTPDDAQWYFQDVYGYLTDKLQNTIGETAYLEIYVAPGRCSTIDERSIRIVFIRQSVVVLIEVSAFKDNLHIDQDELLAVATEFAREIDNNIMAESGS